MLIPEIFDENHKNIRRDQKSTKVQYLGLLVDEIFYWNAHFDYVCKSLVKYLTFSNHMKHFMKRNNSPVVFLMQNKLTTTIVNTQLSHVYLSPSLQYITEHFIYSYWLS